MEENEQEKIMAVLSAVCALREHVLACIWNGRKAFSNYFDLSYSLGSHGMSTLVYNYNV